MTATEARGGAEVGTRRAMPPVTELTVASLALVVTGGVYMAAYIPREPPLALPIVLTVLSIALTATALAMLARIPHFPWAKFRMVFGWSLVAYLISAGMIFYAFVYDHTPAAPLAVVTIMLFLFMFDVPLIIAFTVGRHDTPTDATS